MATFKRFEDILAWQKAREVTKQVYKTTSDGSFSKDFGLRDQLRRASVSIMANIAEGFGRRSDKEFANFLNLAHGSAAECQSHLYIAHDLGYLDPADFDNLLMVLEECSMMINGLGNLLGKLVRSTARPYLAPPAANRPSAARSRRSQAAITCSSLVAIRSWQAGSRAD